MIAHAAYRHAHQHHHQGNQRTKHPTNSQDCQSKLYPLVLRQNRYSGLSRYNVKTFRKFAYFPEARAQGQGNVARQANQLANQEDRRFQAKQARASLQAVSREVKNHAGIRYLPGQIIIPFRN